MTHPAVEEELALLESVTRALAASEGPIAPSEQAIVGELEQIRESLISGAEAKDRMALEQQWERHTALLAQLRKSREAPIVDPDSPYFAHLRLREADRERDLCIGKATRIDEGLRIVDWRHAPISRLFYRYQCGEDYEEEFGGRVIAGRVVARRNVTIQRGRLERVDSPEGSFARDPSAPDGWRASREQAPRLAGGEGSALRVHRGAEALHRRLGTDLKGGRRRRDKHLPDIAGLIDPRQFELIASPSSGLVVVRGSAGSGKTTVALHRIAYLAYEDPTIDSDRTLVLVFSPALRDYVGHVLPSLGIDRVRVRTFHDWAAAQRRRLYPGLPRRTRYDTPSAARHLKLHPGLSSALEERIRRTPGPATPQQAIDDWMSVLTDRGPLAEALERAAPGAISAAELDRAVEWCQRCNEEVLGFLEDDGADQTELDAEDDALLLRTWQLRIGPLSPGGKRPVRYRHLAIDEVQDFSPLEIKVLLECLDRNRSVTLAGDTQQHIMADAGFTSWDEFFRHLGVAGTEIHTLRVSYRSTAQIMRFARSVLGDLAEDEEPETVRSGPEVELFEFTDPGACIAFLADALDELGHHEPMASVAVLTGSRGRSDLYFQGLQRSDVPNLRQVTRQDFSFSPGVEVTEIEQVKGLEFDYVVLVDVSEESYPDTPIARRLLHVGATRAVHQLWVTSVGRPSVLVRRSLLV